MSHRRLLRMIANHVAGRMREVLDGRQITILGRWVLRARGIEGGHGALAYKSCSPESVYGRSKQDARTTSKHKHRRCDIVFEHTTRESSLLRRSEGLVFAGGAD